MRKLTKGEVPTVLVNNATAWTVEFVRDPSGFSRYRHNEVREALLKETFGKCAYCEARIRDVSPVHVEHIIPKSKRNDLVVSWDNLTIACPNCNTHKGDYYDVAQPLLHPYVDDPRLHLIFAGSLVFAAAASRLGERTINRLGLRRRVDLNQSREKRLEGINSLFMLWVEATGSDRDMYAELILAEIGPDQEFSEACRAFLELRGFVIGDSRVP
jgi:hypothetical protein